MHCGKLAEGIGVPLDYDKQWTDVANSNWPFIFESNRNGRFDFRIESNQISKLCKSLILM